MKLGQWFNVKMKEPHDILKAHIIMTRVYSIYSSREETDKEVHDGMYMISFHFCFSPAGVGLTVGLSCWIYEAI